MEELLGRCKESIKTNREKIQALSTENTALKEKLNAAESEQVGSITVKASNIALWRKHIVS